MTPRERAENFVSGDWIKSKGRMSIDLEREFGNVAIEERIAERNRIIERVRDLGLRDPCTLQAVLDAVGLVVAERDV